MAGLRCRLPGSGLRLQTWEPQRWESPALVAESKGISCLHPDVQGVKTEGPALLAEDKPGGWTDGKGHGPERCAGPAGTAEKEP